MAPRKHICITGPVNSGKTTLLYALSSRLESAGHSLGGVIQVLPLPNAEKRHYRLSDQVTGEVRLLLSMDEHPSWSRYGRFWYDPEAFTWASEHIRASMKDAQYLMIDEIGPMELADGGLAEIYVNLLKSFHGTVITVIREPLIDAVCEKFGIKKDRLLILHADASHEQELGKVNF